MAQVSLYDDGVSINRRYQCQFGVPVSLEGIGVNLESQTGGPISYGEGGRV